MYSDRDNAQIELKAAINNSPFEFFTSAPKVGFICPKSSCRNGSGNSGTGVRQWTEYKPELYKCFKCGECHDVIGWIQLAENMDFMAAVKYGAERLGLTDLYERAYGTTNKHHSSFMSNKPKMAPAPSTTKPARLESDEIDVSAYCEEAARHINETDYWQRRGLSLETCIKYGLGFDNQWRNPKQPQYAPTPRLVIPTSKHSYTAVDTRDRATLSRKEIDFVKMKVGKIHFFNFARAMLQDVVFVVEGEIDALSFIEVGFEAVALGSTTMTDKFVKTLIQMKRENKKLPIIVMAMDADEAGRQKNIEGHRQLVEAGIISIEAPYIYALQYNDANDALIANREDFKETAMSYINLARIEAEKAFRASQNENTSNTINETQETSQAANMDTTDANLNDSITDGEYFKLGLWQKDVDGFKNTRDLSTGFKTLDENMCLLPGLYVLGAVPGLGKTTFSRQLAYNLAQQKQPVLYFSYEQSRFELVSKDIARMSFINHLKNKTPKIDAVSARRGGTGESLKEAIKSLQEAAEYARTFAVDFVESVDTLCDVVNEYVARDEKPVVIVDYLQVIAPPKDNREISTREAIDYNVKRLKALQRENSIIVLVISSFNRQNYWQIVDYESFKESGNIEYGCDCLLGLQYAVMNDEKFDDSKSANKKRKIIKQSKKQAPRIIELTCLKSRFSSPGYSVFFKYYSQYDFFEECTEQEAKQATQKIIQMVESGIGDDDSGVKPR